MTAQNFINKLIITQEHGLDEVSALRDFEALLSQGRREALKEMDEAWKKVANSPIFYSSGFVSVPMEKLRSEYTQGK